MMAGFMILGAILSMGKCSFLIAGCNMMNRGQKKQYDEQALCRFMGKIMYCLAFAMLLWLAKNRAAGSKTRAPRRLWDGRS